jgi:hypothetical protein
MRSGAGSIISTPRFPSNLITLPKAAELYERAASVCSLVLAFHFMPFPGLGHIERMGESWRWVPPGE